jgi:hypothetical protein
MVTSNLVQKLGRAGYATLGIVYALVGALALWSAFGHRGAPGGAKEAIATVQDAPFGRALVVAIGLGLLAFAAWRFVQAALYPEHDGRDEKGAVTRARFAVTGAIYGALGVWSLSLARGTASPGGDDAPGLTARVMGAPGGALLVAIAGVAILGAGVWEMVKAQRRKFLQRLDLSTLDARKRRAVERTAIAGLVARGVVFALIGAFLLVAAKQHDPSEARGLGGALAALQERSFGPWLLAVVAAGLVAYGAWELVKSRYRTFPPVGVPSIAR